MTAVIEEFEEALDDEAQERPFNYVYFRRLVKYLRPYQRSLLIVLAFILVGTVATLLEPYLIAVIIDQGVANKDYGLVLGIVGLLVAFRLLAWAAQYLRMFRVNTIGQAVLYDMRNQLFTHIQKLSLRFYDSRPVGKIMSRVTSDVGAINELINGGMATIIAEGLSLIGIVVILFLINWKLALIAYLITPSFYFIFGKLRSRIEKAWSNVRKSQANMNANLNESVTGVRVTQAFAREERNISRFERINRWNRDANVKAIKLDNLIWPIVEMVGMFGTAMLVYFGASEVIAGALSMGVILAFINYLWRFWGPVSALSRVYSQVLAAMASAERIFEFLDTEPEVADRPGARALPPIRGEVKLEDVRFSYDGGTRRALNGVSLDVTPGQTIAIVGPTGAGKTTIINLVMRFYDPTAGRVLIDGVDLRTVALESVRSQISLVLQDPFIFSGTLGDNIRYGKLSATDAEVEAAAKAVRLDEFVKKLPEGYAYEVEERGARLSLGQRQLISFARALLADPRILILDEATSSVDTQTEQLIQSALKTLLAGRTAFIIAHRLSTIRNADVILVMQDGRVAEQGNHEELLEQRGLYYRLIHAHEQAKQGMAAVVG
ncbi:MAG TPA: ABC transporter ATP-binding protein [Thermoflexales bacterium]|nr:ABC transporter ATP-binding protein [Thermoflexales bacterium]HQY23532.1 ABC transporter ATP-binding protein [Thermoflexales bacterium]HRA52883.1 ABC transporter ATP-binding protein [Thermoflexales bacterium]